MIAGFSVIAGVSANAAPITTNATADSYVSGAASTTNYGTSTALIANAKGPVYTHLKFVVTGSNGAKSATLEVYSTSSGTVQTQVFSEPATWTETTITYANQPAKGTSLGSLTTLTANAYSTRAVPINGDGSYAFVLSTSASSARNMQSREAPNAPKLIFTPVVAGSSTTPTSAGSTVTVTNTVTNTVTQPPVTTTALSTVTQPAVTSTVATTVTQPPVTNTVTVTPSPVTSTITITPPPVTNTVTVTPAPVTSTVTVTPAPVTNTVTVTPAPVTTTATVTQPPVTSTVTSATTSTVTVPATSTVATTPTSSTLPSTPTSSTTPS